MQMKKYSVHDSIPYLVYSEHVSSVHDICSLSLPSAYSTLLIAADYSLISDSDFIDLAYHLIDSGVVYFCAWGTECERAHDLFDQAFVQRELESKIDYHIMTTWHHDEPLEEAIWFILFCAMVEDSHWDNCTTNIITVDNRNWRKEVDLALSDTKTFSGRLTQNEA